MLESSPIYVYDSYSKLNCATFIISFLEMKWLKKIFLFEIFRDSDIDVNAVYHQLVATYTSDSDEQPGTSTGHVTPSGRRRFVESFDLISFEMFFFYWNNIIFDFRSRRNAALNSTGSSGSGDWRDKCRQVLDIIWNHGDSAPFREPVDTIEHPGE